MASIINTKEQMKALKEINDGVAQLKTLNGILSDEFTGEVSVAFKKGKGPNGTVFIKPKTSRELNALTAIASRQRIALAKEVAEKARKYGITFDEKDFDILRAAGVELGEPSPEEDAEPEDSTPQEEIEQFGAEDGAGDAYDASDDAEEPESGYDEESPLGDGLYDSRVGEGAGQAAPYPGNEYQPRPRGREYASFDATELDGDDDF